MPKPERARRTVARKQQHVELVLRQNVTFRTKSSGLESYEFVHNALPEIDLQEIDASVVFLGHTLHLPLMVASMTGGYADALRINRYLAEACASTGLAMGVGSQRQAIEDPTFHRTFSIVREISPDIPVVGNIGAAEISAWKNADEALRLVDLVRADALAVHLNPVQELLQPEGSPRFRGVLESIGMLVRSLPVPLLVKEVGAGISATVAQRLLDVGVTIIDVAGAGGTSWAGVELLRQRSKEKLSAFWDWGIPTAEAVRTVAALKNPSRFFTLIASGGIDGGLAAAKCIALGADLAATARPLLQALHKKGPKGLAAYLMHWERELKAAMFLTGSRTIQALQHAPIMLHRPG
jgi:isopentenyl-diphosphate Delta-isomerase